MKRLLIIFIACIFLPTVSTAGPPGAAPVGPGTDLVVKSVRVEFKN